MKNRFREDRRLGPLITVVTTLVQAIARRDRWQIARKSTGPLLRDLLAGRYDDVFTLGVHGELPWLEDVPIAVADDRVALVVGSIPASSESGRISIAAVLVSRDSPRRWLVAALNFDLIADRDFQKLVQFGMFDEGEDLAAIAAHGQLDTEAAAIDWDDPTVVLRSDEKVVWTVADAVAELNDFVQSAWSWLAADRITFGGIYLRARHPELVREYP
ncbi:hypothetical protein E4P29_03375 [Rhodococcus sp. 1R11]|uniref:hypothetical protein n=1 Tax=Rhodococcus sp. 1R11 TaxID=2559614 RepID=UPI001072E6E6|nr:hypothetical protein [Rhodococcus sp. 1R11]TFI44814.1 hypothetical protein E4P29_03375 [Rhodococcus sp. 1R11]